MYYGKKHVLLRKKIVQNLELKGSKIDHSLKPTKWGLSVGFAYSKISVCLNIGALIKTSRWIAEPKKSEDDW